MPQRFLRPGITNSERWNSVSFDAQSFYIRILTEVDDYGRCDGRPSVLLGKCFSIWNEQNPDKNIDLQQVLFMLQQLAASRLILIYEADGKRVLQMLQWQERIRAGTISKWPSAQNLQQLDTNLLPPSPSPTPTPSPTPLNGVVDEAFKTFWKKYPRKEGKGAAYKSFVRLKCYDMMEKIIPAIERHRKTEQWCKDGGRFIPHPTTWLNQGRWDDEGIDIQIKPVQDPNIFKFGTLSFSKERSPKRSDFQDDSSFKTCQTMFDNWLKRRP